MHLARRFAIVIAFGLATGGAGCGDDGGGTPDGTPISIDAPPSAAPTASVVFPAADSILAHGNDYPVVVAGAHADGLERIDVVIDGAIVAGGPGAPTLWRSSPTSLEGGAASVQTIAADGSFEFVVPARLTQKVIGLGDADTGGVQADIDVGFYFTPISFNLVGAGAGVRAYAPGDVFRLVLTATTVEWRHNGTPIATGARPTSSAALHVETWLPGAGAAIADARIAIGSQPAQPVTWTAHVNTTDGLAFATTWNSTTHADGDVSIVSRATATGGASGDSAPSVVTVDNTAPTCDLVSPTGGQVSGTISLQGQGADAHLSLIAFFVDGQLHSQHDGQSSATSAWNTTTVGNGAHTVEVRAYDQAGHSVACPVTVNVAN